MEICFHSIGKIASPYKDLVGMPIQAAAAKGVKGKVELKPEYAEGVQDLDGFSHIVLIYYFHKSRTSKLVVKPFLDDQPRGVFATRAPQRPNPIGLSIVRLTGVEGNTLYIENVDILDGTPLLDIKPYIPHFDNHPVTSLGWLEHAEKRVDAIKSDRRFVED
jgi:tRNA-Thr(GGU) m(6)t(6)A37 methyltransferase TsaA